MAATVEWHVFTGSPLADDGAMGAGQDLCSTDNDAYSSANRTANPIIVGDYSYEKWMALKVTVAPDNWISSFKLWGNADIALNTTLRVGSTATGAAPVDTASTVATNDFYGFTSLAKYTWDSDVYTLLNAFTKYLVWQLQVGALATPGDWGPYTVYYEYTEA